MKKFVFLYCGFEPPGPDTMATWIAWFASIADNLIDSGNPLSQGRFVSDDGSADLPLDGAAITGYSIVAADDLAHAEKLAIGCPAPAGVSIYEALPM